MKKIFLISDAVSLLLAFSSYTFFSFVTRQECSRIHKTLRNYIKHNTLNGIVLVAKDSKLLYSKAFGLADKATQEPISSESQLLIASITKTYTATSILLLAQKGIIDLHKPVSYYLRPDHPVWQGTMPDSMNQITIHHLLTHSSGLADYEKIPGHAQWYKTLHTPAQLVQFFSREPLSFSPGSSYEYQGSNYLLLGLIIEAVSGKSYEAFLNEHIFKPLNLGNTVADTTALLSDIRKTLPHLARGYILDEKTKAVLATGDTVNLSVDYAESAIIATASDLYLFIKNLFSGTIINHETVQKMTTSHMKNPYGAGVGYGMYSDTNLGYTVFTHAGKIEGFESIFMYEPNQKITVIILSNIMGSTIYPLAYELVDAVHTV